MKTYTLPTGYLIVDNYSKGELETLSVGDYGKRHNIKADFLGFHDEINGVKGIPCAPLSEKWVMTLSTQFGCPMKCTFCDVPKIKFNGNASFDDLYNQFLKAREMFPNVSYTERLNIHFARMGEPIFNPDVFSFAEFLYEKKKEIFEETNLRIEVVHPVLTTSCPKARKDLDLWILRWCKNIKNKLYNGQAGLQLSINSTDEDQRNKMFNKMQLSLEEIAEIGRKLPTPIGRKYCLNFAYSSDFLVDGKRLRELFDPEKFMCKITPIHNNQSCKQNGIQTIDGYEQYHPYKKPENSLKENGFDVLVFIPSMDEEKGLVTCGNAVLSGSICEEKENPNIIGI